MGADGALFIRRDVHRGGSLLSRGMPRWGSGFLTCESVRWSDPHGGALAAAAGRRTRGGRPGSAGWNKIPVGLEPCHRLWVVSGSRGEERGLLTQERGEASLWIRVGGFLL